MRDLKYLFAYLVPTSAFLGLAWQGLWSWLTVGLAFGLLPLVELFTPKSTKNLSEEEETDRGGRTFFDWLLYANAALLFGIVGWYLWTVATQTLTAFELIGLTLGAGIVASTSGINVAHELGHRPKKFEQVLAQIMLLPSLYQHFFVEHNRGHHKNIATDDDPASAKLGENVFRFWRRSVFDGWRSAWALERQRLAKSGQATTYWDNIMFRYSICQTTWLLAILLFLGWQAFLGAIGLAIISFLLLETVNYIEHYGLRRKILANGHPEPVSPRHSWNSNHELGRIFLYELTRHSDHHFKSTRKYQILRHIDESPQLPFGYPASIMLALLPPLWFQLMDKRVVQNL